MSETTTLLILNAREYIHIGVIDKFSQIIDDMENIEVKIDDEENILLLLSSLPRSFEHFKDILVHGKECTISLDESG